MPKKSAKKNTNYTAVLILIFIFTALLLVVLLKQKSVSTVSNITKILPTASPQVTSLLSPDGAMTLVMKEEKSSGQERIYTLTATDKVTNTSQIILTKTADSSGAFTLPENSWSPDNKYVFLETNNMKDFIVLKASGELFAENKQYLDIGLLFSQKQPKFVMTDVTGWASNTLLILNTKTESGTKGPSFWFDVSSSSFIQLAR